ncbi:MAG TPA: hypothetical protein PLB96_10065 [Syntrophales bacterium]|nr:hypothetical protein [Syntrophales bacterium]
MGQKAKIQLDILIKKEEDYYLAHCLQFDIIATADTLEDVRRDIVDLCRAHIDYSYKCDNMEYLFSPAPKEVWAEYLAMAKKEDCDVKNKLLDNAFHVNPFSVQEIYCYA